MQKYHVNCRQLRSNFLIALYDSSYAFVLDKHLQEINPMLRVSMFTHQGLSTFLIDLWMFWGDVVFRNANDLHSWMASCVCLCANLAACFSYFNIYISYITYIYKFSSTGQVHSYTISSILSCPQPSFSRSHSHSPRISGHYFEPPSSRSTCSSSSNYTSLSLGPYDLCN